MTIGENIKRIRKAKGLTQKQLAEGVDLSVTAIQDYEYGKYQPKAEQVARIASFLGVAPCNINEILKFDETMGVDILSKESKVFDALISLYGDDVASTFNDFLQLNDEGQRKASEYIDDLMQSNKYKKE